MKKRLAIAAALFFPAHAAFAKDYCNNPDAIQEARTSLSRAYGGTGVGDDLEAVQLSNIEPHPQEDGSIICTGKVVTPKMSTIAAWSVEHYSGVYNATVLQAVDPYHFQTTAQSQQQAAPPIPMTAQQPRPQDTVKKIINNPVGALVDGLFH